VLPIKPDRRLGWLAGWRRTHRVRAYASRYGDGRRCSPRTRREPAGGR
jgi:hypothetical protein